jgi:hypothetical protein
MVIAMRRRVLNPSTRVAPPGEGLEKAVTRIKRMLDPSASVTHNERLRDRVGNVRQYDVVIRGTLVGQPILGVVECKDHNRRKGPSAVEAFAKKTENLGANLRMMVSKRGFTEQALTLAQHEHIGCFSLLPGEDRSCGFSIGEMWYGVIRLWGMTNVAVAFANDQEAAEAGAFASNEVTYEDKSALNWFIKELHTTHQSVTDEGPFALELTFDAPRVFKVRGEPRRVLGLVFTSHRIYKKKRKWVSWSGDGLIDWRTKSLGTRGTDKVNFTVPAGGEIVGSAVETDLDKWEDYEGSLPESGGEAPSFLRFIVYKQHNWNVNLDPETPDLLNL